MLQVCEIGAAHVQRDCAKWGKKGAPSRWRDCKKRPLSWRLNCKKCPSGVGHVEEKDSQDREQGSASGAPVGFQLPRGPHVHRADAAQMDAGSLGPTQNPGSFCHLLMEPKEAARGCSHLSVGCRELQLLPACLSFPEWLGGTLCSPSYPFSHFHHQQSSVTAYTPNVSVEHWGT